MLGQVIDDVLRVIPEFIGVYSIDNLPLGIKVKRFALVVNTDPSYRKGSHWLTIIVKNRCCFYFDSLGGPPRIKEIRSFCSNFTKCYYNPYKHQKNDQVTCGGYSIFLVNEMMRRHRTFSSIVRFFKGIQHDDVYIKEYVRKHFHLHPFPSY